MTPSFSSFHSAPCSESHLYRLVVTTLILLAGAAQAQGDLRVGYVDMKRLLDNAPQVVEARAQIDREFRPRNEALLTDEAHLERLETQHADGAALTTEQRFELERDIRNLRRSIDRRREDLSDEIHFRMNAERKAIEEEIEIAVRTVARQGGYDLVLSSPVAYASDSIDITDQILEFLRADFEAGRNRRR